MRKNITMYDVENISTMLNNKLFSALKEVINEFSYKYEESRDVSVDYNLVDDLTPNQMSAIFESMSATLNVLTDKKDVENYSSLFYISKIFRMFLDDYKSALNKLEFFNMKGDK